MCEDSAGVHEQAALLRSLVLQCPVDYLALAVRMTQIAVLSSSAHPLTPLPAHRRGNSELPWLMELGTKLLQLPRFYSSAQGVWSFPVGMLPTR